MIAPVLQVHDLGVALKTDAGERRVLDGLTFAMMPGAGVGVVGASGAGKSTLGNALMRLLPKGLRLTPGSRMRLGDHDLAALPEAELRPLRGRRIAMVFQEPITALDPSMTVGDQLAEAVVVHGLAGPREAADRARAMLERVGIGGGRAQARRYPHELSGGMRQRLLLAMPLMLDPAVLIADEPTTALDPLRQAEMLDLLDDLRARSGTALLLISHDLDLVAERCAEVLVLDHGRIVERGRPAMVLTSSRAPLVRGSRRPVGGPLLEVRELSVVHGSGRARFRRRVPVTAVDSVSFTLAAGEVLGVVGESGAGKSSLALALLRLTPSRARALRFDGQDLAALDGEPLRRMRRHLQFVPQDAGASLSAHLTCEALVAEGLIVHDLAGADDAQRQARALLGEVGLPAAVAHARPYELSTGERQRVALARALASGPKLLICDEPVSSVDPPTRTHLLELLAELRESRRLAILFITHDLAAVRGIADRVMVLRAGRVVETGPADLVLTAPTDPYTRALLGAVPRRLSWRESRSSE